MESCTAIWDSVLQDIREQVGPLRFNLWFKNTRLESFEQNRANILVPNVFTQAWLKENFSSILRDGIGKVLNRSDLDVRFSIAKDGTRAVADDAQTRRSPAPEKVEARQSRVQFNRILRLDDFVVGPSNRLAYTAALEMIENKQPPFNPLFIHGSVGVGKTHLLQGVWNRIREDEQVNAVYMPAERWTNEFVYALQKGKMEAFRQKYRNVDVFLIDDVHFLSNKHGVQEEFLHTFNALYEMSKRIMFASDAHPKQIEQIKENLVSRFMSGMVAKIARPGYATTLLILRSRAARYDAYFPEDVLEFIAERFHDNVREVESALTTLQPMPDSTRKKSIFPLPGRYLMNFCMTGVRLSG